MEYAYRRMRAMLRIHLPAILLLNRSWGKWSSARNYHACIISNSINREVKPDGEDFCVRGASLDALGTRCRANDSPNVPYDRHVYHIYYWGKGHGLGRP